MQDSNVQQSINTFDQDVPLLNKPTFTQYRSDLNVGDLESPYHRETMANLPKTGEEVAKEISYGPSITDIINDINNYQNKMEDIINNYPSPQASSYGGGFTDSYDDLNTALHPNKPTLAAQNKPMVVGPESGYKRYAGSEDYTTFGYTPSEGDEQEYKYGRAMSWGDTIGKAIGGGSRLAADTFIEGWKGWGRMFDGLISWDSSKLMGSPEEQYEMAQKQEDIMNKYAIYDTAESKDGIFNRQFFGNMLQQSGFAIGAGLQFVSEELLTGGLATAFEPLTKGMALGRMIKTTEKAGDLINDARKVMETVTSSEKVTNAFATAARKIVPLYGTGEDMVKLGKAGAGAFQLTMTGLGGVRRALSEFNMARSESIFESAGTYKRLTDDLSQQYKDTYGVAPQGEELEKIKQHAEDAAHDNFWTNIGVLSVMNRIQFDNMFKGFNTTRKIFNTEAANLEGKAFEVAGKIAGKEERRAFETGMLGRLSATGEIAKTFGKKTAAWEATKAIGKGLMKFEGSEGLQELIQNASDQGLRDYYSDLYHGAKGYSGKLGRVMDEMYNQRPWASSEGLKTFLMGALTGRLISPLTMAQERTIGRKEYKDKKAQAEEAVASLNAFYSNPDNWLKESIANVKIQNKAAEGMEQAAKNHNKYVFNNYKDSAFGKAVASAIKLNMFESIRDTIKGHGENMSNEEFKQAFGIEATPESRKNVKSFMGEIVSQMEDYHTTYENLKDKYADKVLPELYKNNSVEDYQRMKIAKLAVDNSIEILTTNVHKAKQAVKRASALQTEIGSNPNIGSSSIEVLTKMGSEKAIDDHIKLLQKEITDSQVAGVTLTPEARELLKDKKKELELAKKWQQSYKDLLDNTDESYSPSTEGRAYQAFADMVNLFNERAKNTTAISKEDVDDNFIKFHDYIRLNQDHKSYIDAMNILADPKNIELLNQAGYGALLKLAEEFREEHKEGIKKATGTENEVLKDDVEELAKKEKEKETSKATDLEKFLQDEYNKVKNAATAQGIEDIPSYENWKKTAGVALAKRFEESRKPKETKGERILIDGKPAIVTKTTVEGDNAYLDYEGDDGTKGRLTVNRKTNVVTDEQGNIVKLSKPGKTEAPVETGKEGEGEKPPVSDIEAVYNSLVDNRVLIDWESVVYDPTVSGNKRSTSGKSNIIDFAGRKIVVINVNGRNIPFYLSTGSGGKVDVTSGKWYPIFGISKTGWLNKLSGKEINNYYGSNILKNICQTLDKKIGDIRNDDTIPKVGVKGKHFDIINKDLNPTENELPTTRITVEKNIKDTIDFLNNTELAALEGGKPEETTTEPITDEAYNNFIDKNIVSNDILNSIAEKVMNQQPLSRRETAIFTGKTAEINDIIRDKSSIGIEPELEKGDYRKAYALGRAAAKGQNINLVDNLDLINNYPNLIEAATKIEADRIKELDEAPKDKINAINEKYDKQAKDLIATGKPLPEDVEEDGDVIPDTSQVLDRKKLAEMRNDSEYGNREYQEGWRQLAPNNSLANTTDIVKVNVSAGTVQYSRDKVNPNYVFDVATPNVNIGKGLTYKPVTDEEYYDKLEANRLTGTKYKKADLFNEDGTVKEDRFDEVPIGVYAEINGKETLIGTLHEPLWIEYQINGKYPHIATPEGVDEKTHVQNEVKANKAFRKTVLEAFNKNPNFVITGHISDKSIGILKMIEVPGLLKERINPEIGKGGEENPHGFFAIVRNGRLETSINNEATKVQETNSFTEKIDDLPGIPALMLPTPTGTFMPTFIDLPKVDKGQAEFIIESWKAFTGKTENEELIDAVYNSLNRKRSEGAPDIGVLRDYISQYITSLENGKLDRVGNGSEAKPGDARINIFNDGNLGIEVKDAKTGKWFNNEGNPIRKEEDLPENIIDLLQNLKTTIKFENRRNSDLVGINSTKKINFLSMEDGKLVSKEMTYNEYIMERAKTFVEKGTPSENKNNDWVYFANPVIKMDYANQPDEETFEEETEKKDTIPVGDLFEDAPDEEDMFAQLERAAAANEMTEKQVKEEADKCGGNPFADA